MSLRVSAFCLGCFMWRWQWGKTSQKWICSSITVDSTPFVPTPSVVNPDTQRHTDTQTTHTHTPNTQLAACHQLEWKRKQWTLFTLHHTRNNTPWASWIISLLPLFFFFSFCFFWMIRQRFTVLVMWSSWSLNMSDDVDANYSHYTPLKTVH